MRIWIAKNHAVSIPEQVSAQIILGIVSQDLKAGEKLPSIRALAQRNKIHSNTVSAAYQDLVRGGWLESRAGSGFYVRPLEAYPEGVQEIDRLVVKFLNSLQTHGYTPNDIRERLDQWLPSTATERLMVYDPEPALEEILLAEIVERVKIRAVRADFSDLKGAAVAALGSRAKHLQEALPVGVPRVLLRLRSIPKSIKGEARPSSRSLLTVASGSVMVLQRTRAVLHAVGIDPETLVFLNTADAGWRERLKASSIVIADVVTARQLPAGRPIRVFRVVADSSLEQLNRFFVSPSADS